jgi:hypothetical protein
LRLFHREFHPGAAFILDNNQRPKRFAGFITPTDNDHLRALLATRCVVADDQDPSQAVGSLRRGGAKIPEIRKHPPETGPKTGLKTASTLSAVEPVSAPPKRKLENRHQRPEPETRPARAEMPEIADQRLGHPSLTCGNVGDSPPPGNNTPETGLAG